MFSNLNTLLLGCVQYVCNVWVLEMPMIASFVTQSDSEEGRAYNRIKGSIHNFTWINVSKGNFMWMHRQLYNCTLNTKVPIWQQWSSLDIVKNHLIWRKGKCQMKAANPELLKGCKGLIDLQVKPITGTTFKKSPHLYWYYAKDVTVDMFSTHLIRWWMWRKGVCKDFSESWQLWDVAG